MLELSLSGVVAGISIRVLGFQILPILLLYALARLDVLESSRHALFQRKTVGLIVVFLLALGIGALRTSEEGDAWYRRDGSMGEIRGSVPIHTQPQRFQSYKKLLATSEVRPTFDGWLQHGMVDGLPAYLMGRIYERPSPKGSWLAARCRLNLNARFFCRPMESVVIAEAPPKVGHHIAMARLRAAAGFLGKKRRGEGSVARRYAASLGTGARQLLPPLEIDRLARLGLLHLWAVSGLHVLLVAGMMLTAIQSLYIRMSAARTRPAPAVVAGLCSLPLVYLYAVFCGLGPSVIRASIAFTIYVVFRWARRAINAQTLLMLTVTLELTRPINELLRAGSLLSHSAVVGIIVAFSIRTKDPAPERGQFKGMLAGLWKTGLAATLATAPFQVLFFGSIAPAGILLGLFFIPFFAVAILPLCLLTAASLAVNAPDAINSALIFASTAVMDLVHVLLNWVDRPSLRLSLAPEHATLCASLVILFFWAWKKNARRRALFFAVFSWLMITVFFSWGPAPAEHLELVAFDVGHGDAFLIRSADAKTILIDAGSGLPNGRGAKLGPERLRRLGVTQIDLLVLTHRHPDHFGGTFRLVPDIPIKRCVVPAKPFSTNSPAWNHLMDELYARGVHCLEVHHGSRIQISDLKVEFLAPAKKVDVLEASASDDENLWSLAARIYSSDGTIWIFGDAPQTLEMDIMALNPTLPPGGVLLVPHHGSDTSSSEELLDGLQPDVAVVSHKRPLAKSVVDRYRKRRIPVCGTNPGGTVHLMLRKGRIWVPMGCILR